jgi:DNA-binding response OmpR family regulator
LQPDEEEGIGKKQERNIDVPLCFEYASLCMKTVLVIEDDLAILEAIQISLELAGFRVVGVTNGSTATHLVTTSKPDIILIDLLLSGQDGCEIVLELKSNSKTKNVPVIMLSAHPQAATQALRCGATDFLAKPFDMDTLLTHIRRISSVS